MAPSRAQGMKKKKKKSNVFSASTNVKEIKRKNKSFGVNKAKDKVISKKKVGLRFEIYAIYILGDPDVLKSSFDPVVG